MKHIIKKELKDMLLYCNTTYIYSIIFGLISTLIIFIFDNELNVFNSKIISLNIIFKLYVLLLIIIIPGFTVRSVQENKNDLIKWLRITPIKNTYIVIGKNISIFIILFLFLIFPSFINILTIKYFSSGIDYNILLSSYMGICILTFSIICISNLISFILKDESTSYILSVFTCFILSFGIEYLSSYEIIGNIGYLISKYGILWNYNNFIKGIIDTRSLFYFISLNIIVIIITIENINNK